MLNSEALEAAKLALKCLLNHQGARREHARRLFLLMARRFTPYVVSDLGLASYLVSTRDDGIGNEVFLRGSFDAAQHEAAYEWLRVLGYGEFSGRILVDVGANIGTNAIAAVSQRGFAGAIACEPDPFTYRLLRANVILNEMEPSVRTLPVALSDHCATADLFLNPQSPGTQTLHPAMLPAADKSSHVTVKLTTFDRLVELGEIDLARVGLVWIDTQAHEPFVLRGAHTLLASDVPVILEYWPEGLRQLGQLEELHELVREHFTRVVDLRRAPSGQAEDVLPSRSIQQFTDRYHTGFTDLLLLSK